MNNQSSSHEDILNWLLVSKNLLFFLVKPLQVSDVVEHDYVWAIVWASSSRYLVLQKLSLAQFQKFDQIILIRVTCYPIQSYQWVVWIELKWLHSHLLNFIDSCNIATPLLNLVDSFRTLVKQVHALKLEY